MNNEEMIDHAYMYGYNYVTTTASRNGYPSNMLDAIVGTSSNGYFENFSEAEEMANEVDGEIIIISQCYGWELWTRGRTTFEPLEGNKMFINDEENSVYYRIAVICYNN